MLGGALAVLAARTGGFRWLLKLCCTRQSRPDACRAAQECRRSWPGWPCMGGDGSWAGLHASNCHCQSYIPPQSRIVLTGSGNELALRPSQNRPARPAAWGRSAGGRSVGGGLTAATTSSGTLQPTAAAAAARRLLPPPPPLLPRRCKPARAAAAAAGACRQHSLAIKCSSNFGSGAAPPGRHAVASSSAGSGRGGGGCGGLQPRRRRGDAQNLCRSVSC